MWLRLRIRVQNTDLKRKEATILELIAATYLSSLAGFSWFENGVRGRRGPSRYDEEPRSQPDRLLPILLGGLVMVLHVLSTGWIFKT